MLYLFWDYDETMVDTEHFYAQATLDFFKKNEYWCNDKEMSHETYIKKFGGLAFAPILSGLQDGGYIKNSSISIQQEMSDYYGQFFQNLSNNSLELTDHMLNMLNIFNKNSKINMSIVSSTNTRDFIRKMQLVKDKSLDNFFSLDKNVYLCTEFYGCRFKPAPDIYKIALDETLKRNNLSLNKNNDTILIVEDSATGCMAGAGFKDIVKDLINVDIVGYRVTKFPANPNDLLEAGANKIINSSDELIKYLSKIIS